MKRFTGFLTKVRTFMSGEYLKYTGLFLMLMMIIYVYLIFAGMAAAPKFTYASF